MTFYQLFRHIHHHRQLALRRTLDFQRNQVASYVKLFFGILFIIYLVFLSVLLAIGVNNDEESAVGIIILPLSFVLLADFIFRFAFQETPAQIVKPYILLPFPRKWLVDAFVAESFLSWSNLTWLALPLPFCIMSLHPLDAPLLSLQILLLWLLLILLNSQWYLVCRTLTYKSWKWFILPVVVMGMPVLPFFVLDDKAFGHIFDQMFQVAVTSNYLPLYLVVALLLLVTMTMVNLKLQWLSLSQETFHSQSRETDFAMPSLSFLNRYGQTGMYLKLEIMSILRNPAIRKKYVYSVVITIVFSLVCAFTDIYNGSTWENFWCLYCFAISGITLISIVMQPEGNYIDVLMTQRQSLLNLLHAKYILNSLLLLIPLVILFIPVVTGKWPLLMVLGFMLFTAGCQFFLLFQLAVYNKRTISLTKSFTNRDGSNNSPWQIIVTMITFAAPMGLIVCLRLFVSSGAIYVVLAVLGILFIAAEPLWMRNIYSRMMARKYENLSGFHSTRLS